MENMDMLNRMLPGIDHNLEFAISKRFQALLGLTSRQGSRMTIETNGRSDPSEVWYLTKKGFRHSSFIFGLSSSIGSNDNCRLSPYFPKTISSRYAS
jgi:hypothetical protein